MAVLAGASIALGSPPCRSARRRGLLAAIFIASAVLLEASASHADESQANEYAVKAAFLYNFAKFAEWPADAFADERSPIVVGVLGVDPFGPMLDEMLASKTAHARPFTVRRLARPGQAAECHLVFVAGSSGPSGQLALQAIGDRPVLTVGESSEFIALGGLINFQVEQNRVVFEVGAEKSAVAPVRLSSQLLKLARLVRARHGGTNG